MKATPVITKPHHRTKKRFGEHEVYADCVIDHDMYSYFRVSIEVPRDNENRGEVYLNGSRVGFVDIVKDGGRKVLGFKAFRGSPDNPVPVLSNDQPTLFEKLGKAVASIISDLVK